MVNLRFFELRQKEVINICTCKSLGCPVDVEFECKSGRSLALVIPGPGKFWGMLGRNCEYIIPWDCVVQIGDDIILVEIKEDMCLKKFS